MIIQSLHKPGLFIPKGDESTEESEGGRALSIRIFFFVLNRNHGLFFFFFFFVTLASESSACQLLSRNLPLLTILQISEYGLSKACFVFSLFLQSSREDFVDLMCFLKVQIVRVWVHTNTHDLAMCCWKNFKIGLKSIKIIKCLAGTASTCSILFCQSHGCSDSSQNKASSTMPHSVGNTHFVCQLHIDCDH